MTCLSKLELDISQLLLEVLVDFTQFTPFIVVHLPLASFFLVSLLQNNEVSFDVDVLRLDFEVFIIGVLDVVL